TSLVQHVGPFGMAAELGVGERAERDDLLARRAGVLDGARHQLQAGALAAESVGDFGVVDDDHVLADLAERHLRDRTFGRAQEIATLRARVLDPDVGRSVCHALGSLVSAAYGERKRRAASTSFGLSSW